MSSAFETDTEKSGSHEESSDQKYRGWLRSFIFHFRPKTVDPGTLRFSLTFGLGGIAFILVSLLFATGLLMKFHYLPFPDRAFESVLRLNNSVPFGGFIRSIHYWSANLLVIVTFLHLLRVFFTSAYHSSRKLNWIIGLCLLILVLTFNFTGYLLPWNQLSFWAITVCTSMLEYIPVFGNRLMITIRGGVEVSETTLTGFYAVHTAILPILAIAFILFHFWRVRKAGGVVFCRDETANEISSRRVPFIPNLLLREFVVSLITIAVILYLAILFEAPTGVKANPGLSPNPTKAPWYFMGFQELLAHFHPLFAVFIIPVIALAGLIAVAFIRLSNRASKAWFISKKGQKTAAISGMIALVASVIFVVLNEFVFRFSRWLPDIPLVISEGIIPFCGVLLVFLAVYWILVKKYDPGRSEKTQLVFVFFLVVFVTFTLTGIWFRGEGARLIWPGMG